MKALRIGVVCFSSLGGSGTIAVELACALATRGHRVTVLAEERPPRLPGDFDFVAVAPLRHALFTESPYSLALASAIVRAHRAAAFDVLHVHYAVPHAASAVLVRETLGRDGPAVVVTLHGSDVTTFGAEDAHGPVIGASLRALDATTTPSRFLRDAASAAYRVDPVVVPNFVDARVFRPEAAAVGRIDEAFGGRAAAPATTLVHVSNFRPVKATRALVPMLAELLRRVPGRVRLVAIGDGPDRASVEADARSAGIADAIRFVAPVREPAVLASWVAAADVFVLPSESESFGLAALEALACGVPVVARNVGGVGEVVRDGATGVLVGDVRGLAGAVAALAADAPRRAAMRAAAIADARGRFSPGGVVDAYETVHRQALERWRDRAARRPGGDHA